MKKPRSSPQTGYKARKVQPATPGDPRLGCTFIDPTAISLAKLQKELCSAGSYDYCKVCRLCGFGKEYVRRMDEADSAT